MDVVVIVIYNIMLVGVIVITQLQFNKIIAITKAQDKLLWDILQTFKAQDKFNKDVVKDLQNLYMWQKLLDKSNRF